MVEEKNRIEPSSDIFHDPKKYIIKAKLPGVNKKDIDLEMTKTAVCLNASKNDSEYSACWTLAHPVNLEKVEAKYEDGLLEIIAPLTEKSIGEKIEIKDRFRRQMEEVEVGD